MTPADHARQRLLQLKLMRAELDLFESEQRTMAAARKVIKMRTLEMSYRHLKQVATLSLVVVGAGLYLYLTKPVPVAPQVTEVWKPVPYPVKTIEKVVEKVMVPTPPVVKTVYVHKKLTRKPPRVRYPSLKRSGAALNPKPAPLPVVEPKPVPVPVKPGFKAQGKSADGKTLYYNQRTGEFYAR